MIRLWNLFDVSSSILTVPVTATTLKENKVNMRNYFDQILLELNWEIYIKKVLNYDFFL